jgi:hypothetical protein
MSVYNFPWITPQDFDINKVVIDKANIKGTKRVRILYKYDHDDKPKDLHITVPRNKSAYIFVDSIRKDIMKKGQEKIDTKRYTTSLTFDSDNEYHNAFFSTIREICEKFEEHCGKPFSIPFTEKRTGISLYAGVIQSNDGAIYTQFYSDDELLDILEYGSFVGRPALSFSGNTENGKIRCQIYQSYVHEKVRNFPLAIRD